MPKYESWLEDEFDVPFPSQRKKGTKPKVLTEADRLALYAEPISEKGSDHFYGAWKGGSGKSGGGPADSPEGRAITGGDRWADHDALIKEMGDKYPGTDWSDMKKLDIATASLSADQIDSVCSRFGPIPNFRGVKVTDGPPGVIAEVKRLNKAEPGSAVFLYNHYWKGDGLAKQFAGSKDAKAFTSNGLGSKEAMGRAIITHELGHAYMGLNLHSRLGENREAAVRKELEPWFHGTFLPHIKTAHVSKYARRNPHEAWAELFSAATGSGQSTSHFVPELKTILDKHYPTSLHEAAAVSLEEAKTKAKAEDPALAPHCGWAFAHPEVGVALTEADRLALYAKPIEEKAASDHFYGAWRGGSKSSGGGAVTVAKSSESTPDEAIKALANGERPTIDKGDMASMVDKLAGRDDHLDVTELHVNGTPSFGLDGLGISRKDMPQLSDAARPKYLADLKTRGVKVTEGRIDPRKLQPIQKEVDATAAAKIAQAIRGGKYIDSKQIVISNDNYVLDGHHRWAAGTMAAFEKSGVTLPYVQVDLPGRRLLRDANRFVDKHGVARKAIGEGKVYTLTAADRAALRAAGHPVPPVREIRG